MAESGTHPKLAGEGQVCECGAELCFDRDPGERFAVARCRACGVRVALDRGAMPSFYARGDSA